MEWILENEGTLRLLCFAVGLLLFFLLGLTVPFRRIARENTLSRWWRNIFFIVFNSLLLRLLIPVTLTAAALYAQRASFGVLNQIEISFAFELLLSLVVLDALIYWQHRIFHLVPLLWRFHRLHHTDLEFDATTAGRFHPVEILLSYVIKALAVLLLGINPVAIIIYEILLSSFALFNHSNFSFPAGAERRIRAVVVTPSMHRIHHSIERKETNSNYGNCLSCWDRLFSSYTHKSEVDPQKMPIGLHEFRSNKEQTVFAMLRQPFSPPKPESKLDS